MAGVEEMYASNSDWLKAEDLGSKEVGVKIEKTSVESVGLPGKEQDKLLLTFKGKEKGLLLNKTNAKVVAKAYGDDYSGWNGCDIILFPTVCEYEGKSVDCIRLRIPLETAGEGEAPF